MIYIYTKNHPNQTGILDFLLILQNLFKKYNLKLDKKNEVIYKNYIFIDEFSDYFEINYLLKKKIKKKLTYILFSTEFETNNRNGKSFNQFKETNKIEALIINLISTLLFFTPKRFRNMSTFGKLSAFFLLPFAILKVLTLKKVDYVSVINEIKEFKRRIYMKARRKGFDIFSRNVDLIIKIHPLLNNNKNDTVIYPLINDLILPKNNKIKVSGTQTNYRVGRCVNFKKSITEKKLNYNFKFDLTISFQTDNNEIFGFSFQPAQSQFWEKSNPVKIWRDFTLHQSIPIVDKKFNDHEIEWIAITTDQFLNQEYKNNQLLIYQNMYKKFSQKKNRLVFETIHKFLRN